MNILFVTSPAPEKAPFSTTEKRPPLGVGSLISTLRRAGHKVFFEDFYLRPSPLLDSPDFLRLNKIDLVGIYSNTICYAGTLDILNKLQGLRESGQWSGKIAVGGPHTSFGAEAMPEYVDHIVIGEGEIAIMDIVEGAPERIIRGQFVEDMDSLPFPVWDEFIHRGYDWTYRDLPAPVYTMNTSRGCPFSCTFCSVKGVWGRTYRFMSANRVISDLERMIEYYGLKTAYFREDHFTLNKGRTAEFCGKLLQRGMDINWCCETRADSIDDQELIKLMAESGCKYVYVGVESGSQKMLDLFKKGETVEQFERVIGWCGKYGIKVYGSFVVGAPEETEEDVKATLDFIRRTRLDSFCLNVFVGLPGSELYDHALSRNLHEYKDPLTGLIYLKGHNERAMRYYGPTTSQISPVPMPLGLRLKRYPLLLERFLRDRASRLPPGVKQRIKRLLGR